MNRRERRATIKRTGQLWYSATSDLLLEADGIDDVYAAAMAHYRRGEFAPAESLCRAILLRQPRHLQSLVMLGDMAQQGGRNKLAVKLLGQALALDSRNAAAHDNIALAYQALGCRDEAVRHFRQAIALGLRGADALVKETPAVAACLKRLADAWPKQLRLAELLGAQGAGPLASEALLLALLQSAAVCDFELERLLTAARRGLLQQLTEGGRPGVEADSVEFFCALAQRCFINEYVFAIDDIERAQLQQIHNRIVDALGLGAEIAPLDLIVTASYLPLHTLPMSSALLRYPWPDVMSCLLTQQICEPLEEESDRKDIPALTQIDDAVSLQVQNQYEENPYPRWTTVLPVNPTTLADYLRDTLGVSPGSRPGAADGIDILIAGCGTGSHSIDTAQRFPQSRVLAVDISRASLAYARRKTGALGISNIAYSQADILKLASIDRRFDLIEVVGVLHHLADPAAGWRALLSLLRPNGLMFIGLYSALARRSVTAARAFIAERGYLATADDIRASRQDLIRHARVPPFKDFATTSGCRDLLFNVMEHRFTIPQIKEFLDANHLAFLGFEQLPPETLARFWQQYPAAMRDLASWHSFEQLHPLTFSEMYLFWVQKKDPD